MFRTKKFYELTGSFDFYLDLKKSFKSADDAIKYALKLFPSTVEVQEEIVKSNTSVEYVISQTQRFTVTRVSC